MTVPQPTLRKSLTLVDGVSIVVGITIGAGIFSTPQIIAGYHSSFGTIAVYWVLGGLLAFTGGLIYAELGTRLPNTGGEYVYLTRAFGPYVGFIFGWAQLFIIRTSPGAGLAIITANYLGYFIPLTDTGKTGVALGTIAILGTVNYVGIQWASFYQRPSSIIKAVGLLALALAGLAASRGEVGLLATTAAPTASLGPVGNASAAFMLIVFSYLGWDRLGYVAGEMKNPRRVIPPSLLISVATIAGLPTPGSGCGGRPVRSRRPAPGRVARRRSSQRRHVRLLLVRLSPGRRPDPRRGCGTSPASWSVGR